MLLLFSSLYYINLKLMSQNSVNIFSNALYSLRPFEKICLYSFDVRRNRRVYEEFYNRDGDFVFFRSNSTHNGEFVEDNEQIGRILYGVPMIIKIVKVYSSGATRTLFDYRDQQRRINTPRPRRTN
jgi:hypothetical protein